MTLEIPENDFKNKKKYSKIKRQKGKWRSYVSKKRRIEFWQTEKKD